MVNMDPDWLKVQAPKLVEPEITLPVNWLGVFNQLVSGALRGKVKLDENIIVTPAFVLKEKLDSLDIVEVIMTVEEMFGLDGIPDDAANAISSVGDVVDYICYHRQIRGDRSEWTPNASAPIVQVA